MNLGDAKTVDGILSKHIEAFGKGLLEAPDRSKNLEIKKNRDNDIVEKLGNTRPVRYDDFSKIVLAEEHDVLLLVYSSLLNSTQSEKSSQWAFDFDSVALRFR